MAALELDKALLPTTLTTSEGIAANKHRIKAYDALIDTNAENTNKTLITLKAEVEKQFGGTKFGAEWISNFDKSMKNRQAIEKEMYDNQKSLIKVFSEINQLMEQRLGVTGIENNQIQFSTQEDLDQFNALFGQVDKLANEEEAIGQKYRAMLQSRLNQMNQLERGTK